MIILFMAYLVRLLTNEHLESLGGCGRPMETRIAGSTQSAGRDKHVNAAVSSSVVKTRWKMRGPVARTRRPMSSFAYMRELKSQTKVFAHFPDPEDLRPGYTRLKTIPQSFAPFTPIASIPFLSLQAGPDQVTSPKDK